MKEQLEELQQLVLNEKYPFTITNKSVKIPIMKWAVIRIVVREMIKSNLRNE